MTKELVSEMQALTRLRVLVGYLGEKDQFAWWTSGFYSSSSSAFLQPAFPRTMHLAQYHGVCEAARLIHDERLSAGCYHLFRLHEEWEQRLHEAVLNSKPGVPTGSDGALEELGKLASESPVGGQSSTGPVKVETPNDPWELAQRYLTAFETGIQVFPFWNS